MRKYPAQHLPSLLGVAYAENDVFSAVGFGARAQDGCLYVGRFERRRTRRKSFANGFSDGQHASILSGVRLHSRPGPEQTTMSVGYPILSRNSSAALPMRFSRRMSRTVRSGWATYQPSAAIWYLAIQSFTEGSRNPGNSSSSENRRSSSSGIFVANSSR